MDNIFRRPDDRPLTDPEPEFAPERDFPAVVPERSELPSRPLSRDELDMIPQHDEI